MPILEEDEFSISSELITAYETKRNKTKTRKCTGYAPLPYPWIEALRESRSIATFKVAHYVLKRGVWQLEPRPVPMPGVVAEEIGISLRTLYDSILELEARELCAIGRKPLRVVPRLSLQ
jgi:hypothetical protein